MEDSFFCCCPAPPGAVTAPPCQNLQYTSSITYESAHGPISLLVNPNLCSDIIWPFRLTFFSAFNWGYGKRVQRVCTEVHLEKHFPSPPGKWWLVYATHFWKHFLELESCLPDCYAGCQNRASFSLTVPYVILNPLSLTWYHPCKIWRWLVENTQMRHCSPENGAAGIIWWGLYLLAWCTSNLFKQSFCQMSKKKKLMQSKARSQRELMLSWNQCKSPGYSNKETVQRGPIFFQLHRDPLGEKGWFPKSRHREPEAGTWGGEHMVCVDESISLTSWGKEMVP